MSVFDMKWLLMFHYFGNITKYLSVVVIVKTLHQEKPSETNVNKSGKIKNNYWIYEHDQNYSSKLHIRWNMYLIYIAILLEETKYYKQEIILMRVDIVMSESRKKRGQCHGEEG